jgi:hypothetical protein
MNRREPLLGRGLWLRPGPATIVARPHGWILFAPGTPRSLPTAAWSLLAGPVRAQELLPRLLRAAEPTARPAADDSADPTDGSSTGAAGADAGPSADRPVPEIVFCLQGPDGVAVGTTGESPVAVHTATGRRMLQTDDEAMAVHEAPDVLRVAFGQLPDEDGDGALRLVDGMARARGLVHELCEPDALADGRRRTLTTQVADTGRHVERDVPPAPRPAPLTPRPEPQSVPRTAPLTARTAPLTARTAPLAPAPTSSGTATRTRATTPSPGVFAALLAGPPAPARPHADTAARAVPSTARTSAPTPDPSVAHAPDPPAARVPGPPRPSTDSASCGPFGPTRTRSIEGAAVRPAEDGDEVGPDPGTGPGPGVGTDTAASEEAAVPDTGPTRARTPAVHVTGTGRLALDRATVVGRRPHPSRAPYPAEARVLPVSSPGQRVSRSHLLLRPDGDRVLATDLGSANGTWLCPVLGPPVALPARTETPVPEAACLDLGDGVLIKVLGLDDGERTRSTGPADGRGGSTPGSTGP